MDPHAGGCRHGRGQRGRRGPGDDRRCRGRRRRAGGRRPVALSAPAAAFSPVRPARATGAGARRVFPAVDAELAAQVRHLRPQSPGLRPSWARTPSRSGIRASPRSGVWPEGWCRFRAAWQGPGNRPEDGYRVRPFRARAFRWIPQRIGNFQGESPRFWPVSRYIRDWPAKRSAPVRRAAPSRDRCQRRPPPCWDRHSWPPLRDRQHRSPGHLRPPPCRDRCQCWPPPLRYGHGWPLPAAQPAAPVRRAPPLRHRHRGTPPHRHWHGYRGTPPHRHRHRYRHGRTPAYPAAPVRRAAADSSRGPHQAALPRSPVRREPVPRWPCRRHTAGQNLAAQPAAPVRRPSHPPWCPARHPGGPLPAAQPAAPVRWQSPGLPWRYRHWAAANPAASVRRTAAEQAAPAGRPASRCGTAHPPSSVRWSWARHGGNAIPAWPNPPWLVAACRFTGCPGLPAPRPPAAPGQGQADAGQGPGCVPAAGPLVRPVAGPGRCAPQAVTAGPVPPVQGPGWRPCGLAPGLAPLAAAPRARGAPADPVRATARLAGPDCPPVPDLARQVHRARPGAPAGDRAPAACTGWFAGGPAGWLAALGLVPSPEQSALQAAAGRCCPVTVPAGNMAA